MATLIPAIGSCLSRMTSGEKRFARRLEEKLEEDYLCWYDVPIGTHVRYPDFIIFHPQRGLLVIEVKDWKLDTIAAMDKQHATLRTERGETHEHNPLVQARQYMFIVTGMLERDPQLVFAHGSMKGRLVFPYAHGVVLSNISRAKFDEAGLADVLPPHLVICQDEMTESVDPEAFQKRMWDMFPNKFKAEKLTLPQIDRIRWHMFPEVRIGAQKDMFTDTADAAMALPDVMQVMDLQQEQLARSMGEGHRVIHGVAGSGKTLILAYRAEHLARVCARPILVLCYGKALATRLKAVMHDKGLDGSVHVANFHAWCIRQLDAYQAGKPAEGGDPQAFFEACVERVIRSVERGVIPSAQYDAVLIDEGHDFRPEWFRLVVQMIHPDSNSLLVLYDDAQSIYQGAKKQRFSFASVGIQAKGRTTILKLNYRNTAEILAVATAFADSLLSERSEEEDGAPLVHPLSAGRRGPKPLLIKFPKPQDEAEYIAERLAEANRAGMPWREMAVIYRRYGIGRRIGEALERRRIPFQWQQDKARSYSPMHESVKLITMHSSKGLEFPLVFVPALGAPTSEDEDMQEESRLLYVAMTRATERLVMTYTEDTPLAAKMGGAMRVLRLL